MAASDALHVQPRPIMLFHVGRVSGTAGKNNRTAEKPNNYGPWHYHALSNESGCRTVTEKKNAGGHKQNNAAHRKSRCGKTLEGEKQGGRGREYHRDRSGHHQEWCWWALESSAG